MEPSQRVITSLPLCDLFDERGAVAASRSRDLSAEDIRELLRRGPLRFVVANVGDRPQWVPEQDCFAFWKGEVQSHVAAPDMRVSLDDFPGSYCYFASEWSPRDGSPIIVLQKAH